MFGVERDVFTALGKARSRCADPGCFIHLFPLNWSLPADCVPVAREPYWLTDCGLNARPPHSPPTTSPIESRPNAPKAGNIRDVDFANFDHEIACLENQTVSLSDGEWVGANGGSEASISSVTVEYMELTGDGRDDAIVYIVCEYGVSSATSQVLVYSIEQEKVLKIGMIFGFEPEPGPDAGMITVWNPQYADSDPRCCASEYRGTAYHYDGRIFITDGSVSVTAEEFFARHPRE
ncbi:MAG: hypothetical protein M5T61_15515 [Acidimicrobiia bacterium]|nr:hypothetical protein [Acidimicrobiia bacterium]